MNTNIPLEQKIMMTFANMLTNSLQSLIPINPKQQYYTYDNKEIIESYIKSILKNDDPSDKILFTALDYWIDTGEFLTIEQLTDLGISNHLCHCPGRIINVSINHDLNDQKLTFEQLMREYMKFFITEYADFPSCPDNKFCFEYYSQEKKFPLPDQLENYMRNFVSYIRDPLNMGCVSVHKPTQNLEKFKSYKFCDIERKFYHLNCLPFEGKLVKEKRMKNIILDYLRKNDENNCCLCMSSLNSDDKCFILPCNHIYHSDESEECMGLTKWLKTNDKCPTCRAEIII